MLHTHRLLLLCRAGEPGPAGDDAGAGPEHGGGRRPGIPTTELQVLTQQPRPIGSSSLFTTSHHIKLFSVIFAYRFGFHLNQFYCKHTVLTWDT